MGEKITRRERVLRFLQERPGVWISAPLIASPDVGGSEGLRRIRELRADGFNIQVRRHPDRRRAVRQYRLVPEDDPKVVPLKQVGPIWVQGHYRQKPPKPSEVTTMMPTGLRWEPFNHAYGPWYRLKSERNGITTNLSYKGHPVEVTVIPDMDRSTWFWSVSFSAYRPRDPRKQALAEHKVGGRSSSLEEAKRLAVEVLNQGRPS